MIFVGIALNHHDSNISAYINGEVKYAKYERQSGIKHARAPIVWFFDILEKWGIEEKNINGFAYVDSFFNIKDKMYNPAPFQGEEFLLKEDLDRGYGWYGFANHLPNDQYIMLDHHHAHVYSNINFSQDGQAISTDGNGSNNMFCRTWNSNFIKDFTFHENQYPSPGRILLFLGHKIGLTGNEMDICGKIMGLQSYGESNVDFVNTFSSMGYDGLSYLRHWILSLPDNLELNQDTMNTISSAFDATGMVQKQIFNVFSKDKKIVYSGGVSLNVNWNREILDSGYDIDVNPHPYDGGLSLGCLHFILQKNNINFNINNFPYIQDDEAPKTKPTEKTFNRVAELLADNKIVGWYQGHGELGPRALGNRSILMNPSIKNGKDILNQKVKHREWWRPFGASVKKDKASEYFDLDDSPYMLFTAKVLRDDLPSITHVDGTCRHQTVTPEQNPLFYNLLDAFESKTGLPVLLNTSLNVGGKPIAGKIEEAVELFQNSELDALCVGDELYVK